MKTAPARVLIPTRNRPASLLSVIRFLNTYYPETRVIIADGSSPDHAAANRENLTGHGFAVEVDYRAYPYNMPFFDRILDVLEHEDDEYFIMGSDDDYPLMDGLNRVLNRMVKTPDAATGLGATLHFTLKSHDDLTANLGFARPLLAEEPETRAQGYSRWPFSTTYAVTRRELLIERYNRSREVFLPGFYDFGVGVHDAFFGKMIALPEITFIATRNFNHSYLRPEDPLLFVRRSDDFLKMVSFMEGDAERYGGKTPQEASDVATAMILRRVAGVAGAPPQRLRGFESSGVFANRVAQRLFDIYRNIFKAGTQDRAVYEERMRAVVDAMRAVSASTDNDGEPRTVESLDSQMNEQAGKIRPKGSGSTMFKATRPGMKAANAVRSVLPGRLSIDVDSLLQKDDNASASIHILALGQSNAANHGKPRGSSQFGKVTDADGNLIAMSDPIPGGSGNEGSVWPRLADLFETQKIADEFVVTVRAKGGTSIADWSAGGAQYSALKGELEKLRALTPKISHVVWHQGERDTANQTGRENYASGFASLFNLVSEALPEAKWIICNASYRQGLTSQNVVSAQKDIIAAYPSCFAGPNTDLLTEDFRYDNTHFNADGLSEFASMLANAIVRASRS